MSTKRRVSGAVAAAVVAVVLATGATSAGSAPPERRQFVLSPEGNHLWAYDAATGEHQLLARARNGADPGAAAPNGLVRDINGQICVSPDGAHVVTGEDTVFASDAPGGDGAGSHDPRIAGWGWFTIEGNRLGALELEQVGKLAPEAGEGPGYAGDPDNYGCGFLDDSRLLTTAIGNTMPGEEANGQLFLWFGPFERGYREEVDPETGVRFLVGEVDHCQVLGADLATAGGIAVDAEGDVYVATNRPSDIPGGDPAGVWRYSGEWPRTAAECTEAYLAEHITKELVIPSVPGLPVDPRAPTPSAVALSPAGTLYVSSVFSGTVAEYTKDGAWLRDLFPLSPVTPPTGPLGDTPFGLAVTADGALWIADLGIVGNAPAEGEGSLVRLGFADGDPVLPATTVRSGLTFPDGVGVYTAHGRGPVAPTSAPGGPGPATIPATLPVTGSRLSLAVPALLAAAGLAGAAASRRRATR